MTKSGKTCWVVTEGLAGTENQCIGLAEAMGLTPLIKRIKLRAPWKHLSPWLGSGHQYALATGSDPVAPPYPDILITSGRKAVGIGIHIKKQSNGQTFLINIQDPHLNPRHFDLLVVPQHDGLRGDNVIVTKTALHRVTPGMIAKERDAFQKQLSRLPSPRVAVLIGGASKSHAITHENVTALAQQLLQLEDHRKAGLMVTVSRRTGAQNEKYLREQLQGPDIYFWDGAGDNPYFGFLGMADYIIVTEDSVSMTSEALATGKPVYIASLEGGARRLNLFHKMLQDQGYTRPFTGLLEEWSYTPLHETKQVADEIWRRFEKRK